MTTLQIALSSIAPLSLIPPRTLCACCGERFASEIHHACDDQGGGCPWPNHSCNECPDTLHLCLSCDNEERGFEPECPLCGSWQGCNCEARLDQAELIEAKFEGGRQRPQMDLEHMLQAQRKARAGYPQGNRWPTRYRWRVGITPRPFVPSWERANYYF